MQNKQLLRESLLLNSVKQKEGQNYSAKVYI